MIRYRGLSLGCRRGARSSPSRRVWALGLILCLVVGVTACEVTVVASTDDDLDLEDILDDDDDDDDDDEHDDEDEDPSGAGVEAQSATEVALACPQDVRAHVIEALTAVRDEGAYCGPAWFGPVAHAGITWNGDVADFVATRRPIEAAASPGVTVTDALKAIGVSAPAVHMAGRSAQGLVGLIHTWLSDADVCAAVLAPTPVQVGGACVVDASSSGTHWRIVVSHP